MTKLPKVKDLVSNDQLVRFIHYQSGQLWYRHDLTGFEFPVPVGDTGDGVFKSVDKALLFMRWIRKHVAMLQKAAEDMYRETREGVAGIENNEPNR